MVGSRNQCPWLWLTGPEEAAGRGRHGGREDGWLQRLKLTVCEKSSSQVLHLPSISLLTGQGMSGTTVSPFTSSSFTHTLTCVHKKKMLRKLVHTHTLSNTLKADGVGPWPLLVSSLLLFVCGKQFSFNFFERSQSHGQLKEVKQFKKVNK